MANLYYTRDLLSIEYIRVNKIDGIEFVEIHEDGIDINRYGLDYVLVNKIDVIDDEQPVHIYGTVMVKEVLSSAKIVYDRSSNNPETKAPGEYLTLTGPFDADADCEFHISLCLWFDDDDDIVKGEIEDEIVWDPNSGTVWQCDQLVEKNMLGKYGSVTVGCRVTSNAVSATVDVVMVNGDRESPAAVYGTIKATSTLFDGWTRMLFQKSPNEYVQVSSQQSIPLTREVFPVRVESNFSISVDLWDHDSLSPDDQMALGSVSFAATRGTTQKNITSKYGELQVSITYSNQNTLFHHLLDTF